MSEFECLQSDSCGQFCAALELQGVNPDRQDDVCGMPQYFKRKQGVDSSIIFDLDDENGHDLYQVKDPVLVGKLGNALYQALSAPNRTRPPEYQTSLEILE